MKHARVDCGFIRLTDSAVLIAAVEMGFAAEERVDLVLHREFNWSSIRDKIAFGAYPVAHMLAPMPVALSLGVGPMPVRVATAFALSRNGNAFCATAEMAGRIRDAGGVPGDAASVATALAGLGLDRPLRIGVPFPQSMHLLLSEHFLRAAGLGPGQVHVTIAAPPILPQVIGAGEVDLVMVGEPWSSVAVERREAEILLPAAAIWDAAPEKVLGMRVDWAENAPDTVRRLLRALYRAGEWCADPASRATLAEILALPQYLDVASDVVERALSGELIADWSGRTVSHPRTISLGGIETSFPRRSGGMWIGDRSAARWGVSRQAAIDAGAECCRTDILRQALAPMGIRPPAATGATEGGAPGNSFFDGAVFHYSDQSLGNMR